MSHGALAHTGQPARTYEPTPLSLTDSEKAALKALADDRFEGNKSMAARYMIRHFALCQFPLIGIDPRRTEPATNASTACAPAEASTATSGRV